MSSIPSSKHRRNPFFSYTVPHITSLYVHRLVLQCSNGPQANVFTVPSSVQPQFTFPSNTSWGILCLLPHLLLVPHFPLLVVLHPLPHQLFLPSSFLSSSSLHLPLLLFLTSSFSTCAASLLFLDHLPFSLLPVLLSPPLPSSPPPTSSITAVLPKVCLPGSLFGVPSVFLSSPQSPCNMDVALLSWGTRPLWVVREDPSSMLSQ